MRTLPSRTPAQSDSTGIASSSSSFLHAQNWPPAGKKWGRARFLSTVSAPWQCQLSLCRPARSQSLVFGEITEFRLSVGVARCTNPPGGSDFSALASHPVAAGAAESLSYIADHILS